MSQYSKTCEFQKLLISWFKMGNRHLCWRNKELNDWQWLVLELLLKKTRAEAVNNFFPFFIEKYQTPRVVIQTTDQELEKDLRVLGLQKQRRSAMKKIADKLVKDYDGKIPLNPEKLFDLPFVGRYITNAILCFAKNEKRPIVDVNVARILTRFHGLKMPKDLREGWIWDLAGKMLPDERWRDYNYALLDLGALICTSKPKCTVCCVKDICSYPKRSVVLD